MTVGQVRSHSPGERTWSEFSDPNRPVWVVMSPVAGVPAPATVRVWGSV